MNISFVSKRASRSDWFEMPRQKIAYTDDNKIHASNDLACCSAFTWSVPLNNRTSSTVEGNPCNGVMF